MTKHGSDIMGYGRIMCVVHACVFGYAVTMDWLPDDKVMCIVVHCETQVNVF